MQLYVRTPVYLIHLSSHFKRALLKRKNWLYCSKSHTTTGNWSSPVQLCKTSKGELFKPAISLPQRTWQGCTSNPWQYQLRLSKTSTSVAVHTWLSRTRVRMSEAQSNPIKFIQFHLLEGYPGIPWENHVCEQLSFRELQQARLLQAPKLLRAWAERAYEKHSRCIVSANFKQIWKENKKIFVNRLMFFGRRGSGGHGLSLPLNRFLITLHYQHPFVGFDVKPWKSHLQGYFASTLRMFQAINPLNTFKKLCNQKSQKRTCLFISFYQAKIWILGEHGPCGASWCHTSLIPFFGLNCLSFLEGLARHMKEQRKTHERHKHYCLQTARSLRLSKICWILTGSRDVISRFPLEELITSYI